MISPCLTQGKSDIHHSHVKPSSHLGCCNQDLNVTPYPKQWQWYRTKTLCRWDQWLSRVVQLQCRHLTQSDLYSLANWDLRVCSHSSWDPISLPIQVPTSFLPSLPSHQKIHTHANIIFSPFDVYFNHSLQFTMLVWESVFSWLAISKTADLWRHNCKLSDLFFSVTVCPTYTSPGPLILGWLSLLSLLILPPSLTLPHILVPF